MTYNEVNTYSWVDKTGLNLDNFYEHVSPTGLASDTTGYYSAPMRVTNNTAGRYGIDLHIASRTINTGDAFTLCNMVAWADHYSIPSPWGFVLTALHGIMVGESEKYFFLDSNALKTVLNCLGLASRWQPSESRSAVYDQVVGALGQHYPLGNSGKSEFNPAFAPLAISHDLHLSSVAFALATLSRHTDSTFWT